MKHNIATIRENDDRDGEIITISATTAEYDGEYGYRLAASNGDTIGCYLPRTIEQCREDAWAKWGRWETFIALD